MIDYKDEFVASVSHELRTPLTAVVGFAEELRDNFDTMATEEVRELIELIGDQSLEVANIVEDLLEVARLGSESLTLVPEQICALVETDQVVRSLGMASNVSFVGTDDCYAVADSGRFRQVVRNLLTSARRYGGELVEVDASYSEDHAVIQIRDNGSGVPRERWEQIFEPYERTRQSGSTPASVGLGLTVSRQLARLMGGDLAYRYVDGWSVFELSVPMSSVAVVSEA
jgi:signal transduction histidine kinase